MEIEEEEKKVSKHKIRGKHALKHDSLFKGKLEEKTDEYDYESCYCDYQDTIQNFDTDASTDYHFEKENPQEYTRLLDLKNTVRNLVVSDLKMDIHANRRRPARETFNKNYKYLVEHMDLTKYSLADIFVTYSVYFSENLTNMFKLLDNDWREIITKQLYKKTNNEAVQKLDDIDFV